MRWTEVGTGSTRVFRGDRTGAPVWLKVHPQPRKFRQELRAYQGLVPALGATGVRVPSCLAASPTASALILSHVAGADVRTLEPQALPAVLRAAGAALAEVRRFPADSDPMPLEAAIAARMTAVARRARGRVEAALIALAERAIDGGRPFAGVQRVTCHRDFSPRNWRLDDGLGLIDFEHVRADAPMADWLRLEEGAFARTPELRAPFLEGFGRPLSADEDDRLFRLRWLSALGTVTWAVEHRDRAFEARGRGALERLRDLAG